MGFKVDEMWIGVVIICSAAAFAAGVIITKDFSSSAPQQAAQQKVELPAKDLTVCSTVKIVQINTSRNETLLEKVGEGPQLRMLRSGLFGSVGDVFKFCEKAE